MALSTIHAPLVQDARTFTQHMDMPQHFMGVHWGWWLFTLVVLVWVTALVLRAVRGGRDDS